MGQNTDGQICYGIDVSEGEELPWEDEEYKGDEEEWWMIESGFKWEGKEPFDEHGNYAQGVKEGDPLIDEYFAARMKWCEEHPLPIEMVNTCSGDCPMWIVAVPGTLVTACRGYPESIDPSTLFNIDPEKLAQWSAFCEKYGIEGEAGWYLSSYWG